MSRITGSDAQGMMEAYAAVYAPQELTEEQIWEEVENWVNSLLEEGYDLSEYTWEEMYEAYIEERRLPGPEARKLDAERRMQANVARAQAPTPPPSGRNVRGGSGRYQAVAADKGRGGDAAYRAGGGDQAARSGLTRQQIQQKGMEATRAAAAKPAPTPAAKPAPTPAAKPAPAPAAAKPATSTPPAAPTSTPAAPARPSLASQAAELRQMRARSLERQGKPLSAAAVSATAKPAAFQANSFDPFYEYEPYDLVLEYLLSEGHVETLDEALYVMMEMDSETIQNICKR